MYVQEPREPHFLNRGAMNNSLSTNLVFGTLSSVSSQVWEVKGTGDTNKGGLGVGRVAWCCVVTVVLKVLTCCPLVAGWKELPGLHRPPLVVENAFDCLQCKMIDGRRERPLLHRTPTASCWRIRTRASDLLVFVYRNRLSLCNPG